MRTSRAALAGTITVMLLAGSAGSVMVQDKAAHLTGTTTGTERFVHNEDHDGDVVGPAWGISRVENEGGARLGSYRGLILADGSATYLGTYAGTDGYEGLSAACVSTWDGSSGFHGSASSTPGSCLPSRPTSDRHSPRSGPRLIPASEAGTDMGMCCARTV